MPDFGRLRRLRRLSRAGDLRHLFIAMDHTFTNGPIADAARFNDLVRTAGEERADAVILHRGRAMRALDPNSDLSLILHVSGSTDLGPDVDKKVVVGQVEDAVRAGADAISIHINIGANSEPGQLARAGIIAGECDRWQMPLLIMSYPRGPEIRDTSDAECIARAVSVAVDLGADLIKTNYTGDIETMRQVTRSSPVPVLAAGGAVNENPVDSFTGDSVTAGCAGVVLGRRYFESSDPRRTLRTAVEQVHSPSRLVASPV